MTPVTQAVDQRAEQPFEPYLVFAVDLEAGQAVLRLAADALVEALAAGRQVGPDAAVVDVVDPAPREQIATREQPEFVALRAEVGRLVRGDKSAKVL